MNPVRHCRKCDTTTPWGDLRFIGMQEIPGEPSTELRNCQCGCTLCLSTPYLAEASRWVRLCAQIRVRGAIHVLGSLNHSMSLSYEGRSWLLQEMSGDGHTARLAEALYDRLVGEL